MDIDNYVELRAIEDVLLLYKFFEDCNLFVYSPPMYIVGTTPAISLLSLASSFVSIQHLSQKLSCIIITVWKIRQVFGIRNELRCPVI